jgi:hypothetical protein
MAAMNSLLADLQTFATMNDETNVSVPLSLLVDLYRYGSLAPVEGVIYGQPHRARLRELNAHLITAYDRKKPMSEEESLAHHRALDQYLADHPKA